MSENMRIWDQVEKTDPSMTKTNSQGGRSETSVNGVYMAKLATQALGPAGECWGYDIVEERFDNTVPAVLTKGANGNPPVYMMDGDKLVWEQVHTVVLKLWHGNKENFVIQAGHTPYRYMTRNGIFCDKEYLKKSITDAMKKCLTIIGVCSDIYMGMFDDHSYQEAAKIESDLRKADDKDKEYQDSLAKFRADIEDGVRAIELSPNMTAVGNAYGLKKSAVDRKAPILGLKPEEEMKPLDNAYFKRKKELESN